MLNIKDKVITIHTKNTSYQMIVNEYGILQHAYYGDKLNLEDDMSYTISKTQYGFSGNIYESMHVRHFSLDTLPQEISSCGVGDYRINSIGVINDDNTYALDLRYEKYEITKETKNYKMPSFRGFSEILKIYLKDTTKDINVILYYKIIDEFDVIVRYAEVINNCKNKITLDKMMSCSIDLPDNEYDLIHFHGAHAYERQFQRVPLSNGIRSIGSNRGNSSHHHNPFAIITNKNTTEYSGDCYSFAFVYSGTFLFETEVNYLNTLRIQMGINPNNFEVELNNKESFVTPEVAMCYTNKGLNEHTYLWTNAVKNCIIREQFLTNYSPILINNWEATYMDFTEEKLCKIVDEASNLGVEMFVLDDGWFGERNDDTSSLGDFNLNKKKFPKGLDNFISYVNKKKMKFGLWIEPEMISENSNLFRSHPEYALIMPNRKPNLSRSQLVLNMGNKDVVNYLFNNIDNLLSTLKIDYLKWDMNRSLCDLYDSTLSNQKNVLHNYVLGLYDLFERITSKYPNLRIEGCSGGGGRFDLGMLYYQPQIWTSDNTDPIERLKIQYGTSYGYPTLSVGAHVSASPNHQTHRSTPLKTRGYVAYQGTFGYELDLSLLSKEEKELVKHQIVEFKEDREIIYNSRLYRLTDITNEEYIATQYCSEDSLVYIVFKSLVTIRKPLFLKLKGLDKNSIYSINNTNYSGAQLMNFGIELERPTIDYDSIRLHVKKIK